MVQQNHLNFNSGVTTNYCGPITSNDAYYPYKAYPGIELIKICQNLNINYWITKNGYKKNPAGKSAFVCEGVVIKNSDKPLFDASLQNELNNLQKAIDTENAEIKREESTRKKLLRDEKSNVIFSLKNALPKLEGNIDEEGLVFTEYNRISKKNKSLTKRGKPNASPIGWREESNKFELVFKEADCEDLKTPLAWNKEYKYVKANEKPAEETSIGGKQVFYFTEKQTTSDEDEPAFVRSESAPLCYSINSAIESVSRLNVDSVNGKSAFDDTTKVIKDMASYYYELLRTFIGEDYYIRSDTPDGRLLVNIKPLQEKYLSGLSLDERNQLKTLTEKIFSINVTYPNAQKFFAEDTDKELDDTFEIINTLRKKGVMPFDRKVPENILDESNILYKASLSYACDKLKNDIKNQKHVEKEKRKRREKTEEARRKINNDLFNELEHIRKEEHTRKSAMLSENEYVVYYWIKERHLQKWEEITKAIEAKDVAYLSPRFDGIDNTSDLTTNAIINWVHSKEDRKSAIRTLNLYIKYQLWNEADKRQSNTTTTIPITNRTNIDFRTTFNSATGGTPLCKLNLSLSLPIISIPLIVNNEVKYVSFTIKSKELGVANWEPNYGVKGNLEGYTVSIDRGNVSVTGKVSEPLFFFRTDKNGTRNLHVSFPIKYTHKRCSEYANYYWKEETPTSLANKPIRILGLDPGTINTMTSGVYEGKLTEKPNDGNISYTKLTPCKVRIDSLYKLNREISDYKRLINLYVEYRAENDTSNKRGFAHDIKATPKLKDLVEQYSLYQIDSLDEFANIIHEGKKRIDKDFRILLRERIRQGIDSSDPTLARLIKNLSSLNTKYVARMTNVENVEDAVKNSRRIYFNLRTNITKDYYNKIKGYTRSCIRDTRPDIVVTEYHSNNEYNALRKAPKNKNNYHSGVTIPTMVDYMENACQLMNIPFVRVEKHGTSQRDDDNQWGHRDKDKNELYVNKNGVIKKVDPDKAAVRNLIEIYLRKGVMHTYLYATKISGNKYLVPAPKSKDKKGRASQLHWTSLSRSLGEPKRGNNGIILEKIPIEQSPFIACERIVDEKDKNNVTYVETPLNAFVPRYQNKQDKAEISAAQNSSSLNNQPKAEAVQDVIVVEGGISETSVTGETSTAPKEIFAHTLEDDTPGTEFRCHNIAGKAYFLLAKDSQKLCAGYQYVYSSQKS